MNLTRQINALLERICRIRSSTCGAYSSVNPFGKRIHYSICFALHDYLADPFPMVALATSAKILSIDLPLARVGLFETGAGYQAK